MAPIIRGREVEFRTKTASSIAVASGATGWQSVHAYSENFQPGEGTVNDDEIGGARDNAVDPVAQAPGLPNPTGSMQVPLDRSQIGWWLASLFGGVTTVGASAPYTHTFKSGMTAPRLMHIEIPFASAFSKMCDAQAVKTMTLNLGDEDGYKKADLAFIGRSVRKLAAVLGTSPTAAPARDKISGSKGVVKINGTDFGNVLGGSLTMDNGAFMERYVDDSEWPSAVEIGDPAVTASLQIRLRSDASAMLDLFDGLTPFSFELLYQVSPSQSLKIFCPQMTAPKVLPAANGVGAMDVSPQFSAAQKTTATTAPMVTVTLINAVASYA